METRQEFYLYRLPLSASVHLSRLFTRFRRASSLSLTTNFTPLKTFAALRDFRGKFRAPPLREKPSTGINRWVLENYGTGIPTHSRKGGLGFKATDSMLITLSHRRYNEKKPTDKLRLSEYRGETISAEVVNWT